MTNNIIAIGYLATAIVAIADPNHSNHATNQPPSIVYETYTYTGEFNSSFVLPAAKSGLVSVQVQFTPTIYEKIRVTSYSSDPATYNVQMTVDPFIVLPSATLDIYDTLAANINIAPGLYQEVFFTWNKTVEYVTTNQADLVLYSADSVVNSNINIGVVIVGLSNAYNATYNGSFYTVTVVYGYCACTDPDNDGDCEELEHSKKKHKKHKNR